MSVATANSMSADDECRKEFEVKCKFMRVEWSLEWDKAGFYAQMEADRAYTWFKPFRYTQVSPRPFMS